MRVNETTELEIFGVSNPPKRVTRPEAAGLRHLAFYTEDIEKTAAELKGMGIEVEPIRVDEFTGTRVYLLCRPGWAAVGTA